MCAQSKIYQASAADTSELESAVRICLLGAPVRLHSPVLMPWMTWWAEQFTPILMPHLQTVHGFGMEGNLRGAIEADNALALPALESAASLSVGREMLESHDGARHLPEISRILRAVLDRECPGHFATVLALRAAAFHVPLLQMFPAFLYHEWSARQSAVPAGFLSFLAQNAPLLHQLPPLVQRYGQHHPRLAAI